jgi:uncharacterized protein
MQYQAPFWLPGGNLQTIWPAVSVRSGVDANAGYRRERWATPDSDFVDVDWLRSHGTPAEQQALIVLFHGLEGSSKSHYALSFAAYAQANGMAFAVPHFRGCSGELNLAPRAYHSGDYEEIAWILMRMRQQHSGPIIAIGVSLGGNALLRWASVAGDSARTGVTALAAISAPVDLAASGYAIGRGFNRLVYTRMFLNTMKPKALRKLDQYPGLFNRQQLLAAQSLYEFDNVFTAPVHGFANTNAYWHECASKPHLHKIRLPTLIVNALNDPFVPATSLPKPNEVSAHVTLWQPPHGGHVGFPSGAFPAGLSVLPDAVGGWLMQQIKET